MMQTFYDILHVFYEWYMFQVVADESDAEYEVFNNNIILYFNVCLSV